MGDVVVTNNAALGRYEAHLDGELAGFAEYELTESTIVFIHTEVGEAFGGKGVGSALVRESLDDIRTHSHRRVVPICPFYRSWLEKHPDYAELVERRAE